MAGPETPPSTPNAPLNFYSDVVKNTTATELSDLAQKIKQQHKHIELDDDNIPPEEESDSDSDSDYEITPKKHKSSHEQSSILSASDRIYVDNQNLWIKLNKSNSSLERIEEKLRYVQLDLNTKFAECDKLNDNLTKLKLTCKTQQKFNKDLNYYKVVYYYCFVLSMFMNVILTFRWSLGCM
jgi:hypothetical protein